MSKDKQNSKTTIWELFKDLCKELLRSKKFAALGLGVVASLAGVVAGKFGWDPASFSDSSTEVVAMISAYIIGQGVADHGKEKVKLENAKE